MSKRKATGEAVNPSKKANTGKAQATLFNYFKPSGEQEPSTETAEKCQTKFIRDPPGYGIHIYTQSEIEKSPGNQKEFRKFWNEKAFELCSNPSVTRKLQGNRAAIEGVIYSSWTRHKTSLLELQVEELEAKYVKVYKDKVTRDHALIVVKKNMERMLQAHASTDDTYSLISQSQEYSTSLESQLTDAVTELKKAQDALLKAIERRQMDIDLAEREDVLVASSPEPLSQHEIEAMVKVVKNDDSASDAGCSTKANLC